MIFFEIDGEEYAVQIGAIEAPDSIPFTTPAGVTYWMQKPVVVG